MRVVIAEDSVLLREGLTRLLAEAGHDVVAAAAEAEEFLRAVGKHEPDAVCPPRRPPGRAARESGRARPALRFPSQGTVTPRVAWTARFTMRAYT